MEYLREAPVSEPLLDLIDEGDRLILEIAVPGILGDAIVTARVRIPTALSDEERRLLEELRANQSSSAAEASSRER
jgi:DnaJ-class molecular chaperone